MIGVNGDWIPKILSFDDKRCYYLNYSKPATWLLVSIYILR